jgi:cell shape-determining protein MreC
VFDLADIQRQLAQQAEDHRQQNLRAAAAREEQVLRAFAQVAEDARSRRQEQERQEAAQRASEAEGLQRLNRIIQAEEMSASVRNTLDTSTEREHHLVTLAGVLQRTIDTMQRQLAALNQDLSAIREKLAQQPTAQTGYEEASPFYEVERHIDLGDS